MSPRQRSSAMLRRESLAAAQLPYTCQINETVVRTRLLDYVQVFRCTGVSFETVDDAQLNDWHERLNILWRNIASPHVALWTHVIRHRASAAWRADGGDGFADALCERYRSRLARESLMVNDLYLAIVYRPVVDAATGLLARFLRRTNADLRGEDV